MVTTSSTTSVTQNATSQVLTSLGAGSGIDMIGLATNLAAASFAAKTDRLTAKSETLDKQISAASTIKSALSNLATSLGDRVRQGDLSPQPQVANAAVARASLSGTSLAKGTYSLEVTSLAASQTLASPAYALPTTKVGSGTLKLTFGTINGGAFTADATRTAVDIVIPADATLADTAAAINAANTGVTAYVSNTTEGAKLVLKGANGAANAFKLEATETVGDPGLANLAWDPSAPGTGRLLTTSANANFKVDGLPITSASNTVTDAIPGVTLNLTGLNGGAPTQVSFGDPSSAITTAMSDFVSALNEVMATLNEATNAKTGELSRDSGAQALKRTFAGLTNAVIMSTAPEGTPRTLADLGVSIQRDGTFTLDSTRLSATLKANPTAAGAMFTNGLYGIYATMDGISRNASMASDPGSLAGSLARFNAQKTQLATDKTKLADQQDALRSQLVARFSAADSNISASKSTLSFLKNQIAAWNNTGNG